MCITLRNLFFFYVVLYTFGRKWEVKLFILISELFNRQKIRELSKYFRLYKSKQLKLKNTLVGHNQISE